MAKYWFRRVEDGAKVFGDSLQQVARAAQREADKWGTSIQVYMDDVGRKATHYVARKNPGPRRVKRKPADTFKYKVSGKRVPSHAAAERAEDRAKKGGQRTITTVTTRKNPVMAGRNYTGEEWKITAKHKGRHVIAYETSRARAEALVNQLHREGYHSFTLHRSSAPIKEKGRR